jgi:hypothetical protein
MTGMQKQTVEGVERGRFWILWLLLVDVVRLGFRGLGWSEVST